MNVWINWRSNTCGGSDRVGETDANGIATVPLDPSTTGLELMIGGPYGPDDPAAERNSRDLTDSELRELYEKGKLTIRW